MPCPSSLTLRRWIREVRPTLALALPIMSGLAGQMIIGLVDAIMVGRVGVVPLAAASFVNTLSFIPFVFSLGLLSSIAVRASQAFGARQSREAGEILRHGLAMSAAVGIATALALAATRPFLRYLGQPPEVVAASGTYLWLFAASLAPALFVHGCKQFSEAVNRPWAPAGMLLGGVLFNILLNWMLIYGHWGSPALGLEGAGWATLITRLVMAVCFLVYVLRTREMRLFHPERWWRPLRWLEFRSLLAIGFPVAAQQWLEISAFALAAIMAGWIDAESIAAHQIAISCASTSFMFALGIGMAACIRVGHAHGAGQVRRLRRIGGAAILMAAAMMGCFGLMFVAAGQPICRLFVTSGTVVALAAKLLLLAALFQVADGIQVTALSALRGLNDVRMPVLFSGLAYWLIALPLGYLLAFPLRYGAVGIWIGLAAGLGASAYALSRRFYCRTAVRS